MLFSLFFLNTKKPLKPSFKGFLQWSIIPYQEPPGNYNGAGSTVMAYAIIPYQEPPGNYNLYCLVMILGMNYTIPRTTGELQRRMKHQAWCRNYTIPRTTGELQPMYRKNQPMIHYTIPRTTGELQLWMLYEEKGSPLYHTKNHRGTTTR